MLYLNVARKYIASFFKSDWSLEDYPIRFRHQEGEDWGRRELIPWLADVINWWQVGGHGATRDAAYADLRKNFLEFKESGKRLPRPGTGWPIEYASDRYIQSYDLIARDFMQRILDIDYDSCFISDESSLWDFSPDSLDEIFAKVREIYGVDISDMEKANLVDVLERIRTRPAVPRASAP
jgi:hypothetical protein